MYRRQHDGMLLAAQRDDDFIDMYAAANDAMHLPRVHVWTVELHFFPIFSDIVSYLVYPSKSCLCIILTWYVDSVYYHLYHSIFYVVFVVVELHAM